MENEKEKRATFTPGPWRLVCTPQIGDGLVATIAIRLKIASDEGACDHEEEANARLIAAAPELYEQCKLFERVLDELAKQADDSRTGGWAYAEECILRLEAFGIDKEKLREILAKVDGGEALKGETA